MKIKKIILLFIAFILTVNTSFAENKKNLRELFQNNEAVIYSINLRTFNANDKNNNGIIDFNSDETTGSFLNAIERLDELKELGINTIHLLPITPVGKIKALGTAGSLYAMADFHSLNPQLSDEKSELSLKEQAELFIAECHKRNIYVIADLPSCGAYDYFLNRPDLFLHDEKGSPIVPADWKDVLLFDVPDDLKLFKSDIFILHKIFVNNMIALGIDGIRADVATLKPKLFWEELIKYTRNKKTDFMFLAEASENWTEPVSEKAYFTNYKELLEAGFDGYYGNYFNLKNWEKKNDLELAVKSQQKTFKKYKEKKSVIGSFETHDVVSPLISGGENFSKIIIWLNATLPLNPYYIDGFLQADDYIYDYANKPAAYSTTDDEFYYVHQGQIDIFNFSRKPGSNYNNLITEHKLAINIRNQYLPQITKGDFIPLNSDNDNIFAYTRTYKNKSVTVIINRNLVKAEEVNIKLKNIHKNSKITFIKEPQSANLLKSRLKGVLRPAEIIIITLN